MSDKFVWDEEDAEIILRDPVTKDEVEAGEDDEDGGEPPPAK